MIVPRWKLASIAASAALVALSLTATAGTAQAAPVRFGMDLGSIQQQGEAGARPDYGMVWIGAWNNNSFGGPNAQLDQAYLQGVTPAIQFYYWGDDISQACVEKGCDSPLHKTHKDKAGWDMLARQLVESLHAHMKGRAVVIILETEFNKADVAAYEPLDGYLADKATYLKKDYPAAELVLGFGNWGRESWGTWDRAAAACDDTGVQGMRGSTKNSAASYESIADDTLAGAKALRDRFQKPVFLTDIALSSYPEPDYLARQAKTLNMYFVRLAEFKALGVKAILYRGFSDSPTMDTANYFGEAERHWGLTWAANQTAKPSQKVWIDGVKAERASAAPSTAPASTAPTTTSPKPSPSSTPTPSRTITIGI
jgi:hypothetical protein